ncbi:MAG: Rne/Rng family ribonuclease [Candidatus Omnitrophica bacterium]|nr:Rne/Rng family ribonuclease [Candidatus Omnitrophota bacterium]MBU1869632.1 Rne/Rng family ribonuclease [Candidatus Omnitrophota bacterium]
MSKEILINVDSAEKRVAVVSDGKLEEFYIERPQDKTIVGNIYKGRIEAVLPSIGAAFVDIGLLKKGFLYLSEIESAYESADAPQPTKPKEIKKGQEVLVQVVKESFGTKGPRLSCQIGLAGRYLVLMPLEKQVGVSRRIEDDEERRRLRAVFQEMTLPKEVGFIVRTAASGKSKQELQRDAQFLYKLWKRLEKTVEQKKAPAVIYEEYDLTFRAIRDSFTDDVHKLIVDSKPEFYRIRRFMLTFLSYLTRKVELYKGDDLFTDKDIEKQINRINESHVYLKSKAYLVIEPTEGLVVIDVNSGGFKKNLGQEEAAFKVNCEAAHEVARQLILRDLGGIIVIDFIDMGKEGHRREILSILKKALSQDRAKYDIIGISKFGVVEMTRERIHKTVQMLSYQPCPYCQGRGKVRSPVTTAIFALKELKRFLKGKTLKQANMVLAPVVIDEILKNKDGLKAIETKFKVDINLISNPSAHMEEVKIS